MSRGNDKGKFWAEHISTQDNTDQPVTIQRGDWIDESRDGRRIPYKIYLPKDIGVSSSSGSSRGSRDSWHKAENDGIPIVFWSHGLGGSRDGAGFLSRYLASHGYMLVHTQHIGTDVSLWMGKEGHPWDVIRDTTITDEAKIDRFWDVHFALEQLKAPLPTSPLARGEDKGGGWDDILAMLDTSRMGMSGHSMGALTTQVMAGQKFRGQSYQSNAFTAHLAYSHMPSRDGSEAPYANVKNPIFLMTGTEDDSPLDGYGYKERMEVMQALPEQTTKHSLILQDGDHMVFSGSRGQLPGYDKIPLHEDIIKISSLAWWDWHLKGDLKAKDWLEQDLKHWVRGEADHDFA